MRDAAQPIQGSRTRNTFAAVLGVLLAALFGAPAAKAVEMSAEVANLYSSVSIYPPSATSMTVCYGFVCRRREILDFTAGDRSALTQIMAAGRASAAAERAAVQKVVVWFDRRMGPILGTNKRVAKADFRYFDDKHNYDCWDTTRNTTSLLLVLQEWGLLEASRDRRSRNIAAIRWYCRRRTTPRCWSIAPPRSSGSSISGRAAICSHPT